MAKLTFSRIEFRFRDEKGNDVIAIYTEAPRPSSKTKGKFYNVGIYVNGTEIGGFLTELFANKTNARDLIMLALQNPVT